MSFSVILGPKPVWLSSSRPRLSCHHLTDIIQTFRLLPNKTNQPVMNTQVRVSRTTNNVEIWLKICTFQRLQTDRVSPRWVLIWTGWRSRTGEDQCQVCQDKHEDHPQDHPCLHWVQMMRDQDPSHHQDQLQDQDPSTTTSTKPESPTTWLAWPSWPTVQQKL